MTRRPKTALPKADPTFGCGLVDTLVPKDKRIDFSPSPEEKEDLLTIFKQCREEDRHECSLIGHRMSWLITCQSIFVTAHIIAQGHSPLIQRPILALVLCFTALWVNILISQSIKDAEIIINRFKFREGELQNLIGQATRLKWLETLWVRKWGYRQDLQNEDGKTVSTEEPIPHDQQHNSAMAFGNKVQVIFQVLWMVLLAISVGLNVIIPLMAGVPWSDILGKVR